MKRDRRSWKKIVQDVQRRREEGAPFIAGFGNIIREILSDREGPEQSLVLRLKGDGFEISCDDLFPGRLTLNGIGSVPFDSMMKEMCSRAPTLHHARFEMTKTVWRFMRLYYTNRGQCREVPLRSQEPGGIPYKVVEA